MKAYAIPIVALIIVALLAVGVFVARDSGAKAERAKWQLIESARSDAASRKMIEQTEAISKLNAEVGDLRARGERLKAAADAIHVVPDEKCESLPPSFGALWNVDVP